MMPAAKTPTRRTRAEALEAWYRGMRLASGELYGLWIAGLVTTRTGGGNLTLRGEEMLKASGAIG